MFVRFRKSSHRLQLSLVEPGRIDGVVHSEHVASLGSIIVPPSIADRIAFWGKLHQRLAKLSNRIDAATQGKILGSIHARIPMPTVEDQRALQLENAKADADFWSSLHGMQAATVEDHKGLAASVERTVAKSEAEKAKAAARVDAAKDRIARIERGDDVVGGIGKQPTAKDLFAAAGLSPRDVRHCVKVAEVCEIPGAYKELIDEEMRRRERSEKAALAAVRRRHGLR